MCSMSTRGADRQMPPSLLPFCPRPLSPRRGRGVGSSHGIASQQLEHRSLSDWRWSILARCLCFVVSQDQLSKSSLLTHSVAYVTFRAQIRARCVLYSVGGDRWPWQCAWGDGDDAGPAVIDKEKVADDDDDEDDAVKRRTEYMQTQCVSGMHGESIRLYLNQSTNINVYERKL